MTFTKMASLVAQDFETTMETFGFDSFEEMKHCYWWTAADVKEEIDYMIRQFGEENGVDAYIDECDRSEVIIGNEMISYRKFAGLFRKILINDGKYYEA